MIRFPAKSLLSFTALALASCSGAQSGDSAPADAGQSTASAYAGDFTITQHGTYEEPWAAAFAPGTDVLFITEKGGTIRGFDTRNGRAIFVTGAPEVAYGGQGGLGDIAFLESEASDTLTQRAIYLSWAEAGSGGARGAVVGRGQLVCEDHQSCEVRDLSVIWRQGPKVERGFHYSHRIAFAPDESVMFVASGDRGADENAQDVSNTLGSIVRLNLDGTPAPGNPVASQEGARDDIWSYGHRNILGMAFNSKGELWEVEHGPKGGDELNLVKPGANYGWPTRSNGDQYSGEPIADHTPDDPFIKPVISWTPVIAPGDMAFYSGSLFSGWEDDALIAGLQTDGLVRIEFDGETASEAARYDLGARIRAVDIAPDGAIWVLDDGEGAKLRRIVPSG